MKFNPNYITKNGLFEIQIDMDNLSNKTQRPERNWTCKNITYNTIYVYNTDTFAISSKSLYIDKNERLYFKDRCGNKYYIDELEELMQMLQPWAEDMLNFLAHFFILTLTVGFVLLVAVLVVMLVTWFAELVSDKLP